MPLDDSSDFLTTTRQTDFEVDAAEKGFVQTGIV